MKKLLVSALSLMACCGSFAQSAQETTKQLCVKSQRLYYYYRTIEDVCGFNERQVTRRLSKKASAVKCSRQLSEEERMVGAAESLAEVNNDIKKMGVTKFCRVASEIYLEVLNE